MTLEDELIEAICGRGWDTPSAVDLQRARELISTTTASHVRRLAAPLCSVFSRATSSSIADRTAQQQTSTAAPEANARRFVGVAPLGPGDRGAIYSVTSRRWSSFGLATLTVTEFRTRFGRRAAGGSGPARPPSHGRASTAQATRWTRSIWPTSMAMERQMCSGRAAVNGRSPTVGPVAGRHFERRTRHSVSSASATATGRPTRSAQRALSGRGLRERMPLGTA